MKQMFFLSCAFLVASCSTPPVARKIASTERDLSGTYLGVSDYKVGRDGPNKAATRIYFHEIEGEKGSYNVVLLEYVNLFKIAPKYIISNKIPNLANKTGYLNSITQNISTYKATPTSKEGVLELRPLVVNGDRIEALQTAKPRILTLASGEDLASPLAGATISAAKETEPAEIFFPKDDDEKVNGVQYAVAKLTYAKAKLDSTWRKNFLPGPYLSQYAKVDDVVLDLSSAGDNNIADFKINEQSKKVSAAKRTKVFTSPKSAFLKGEFSVSEPLDGMFLFNAVNSDESSKEIVQGRIGLFIDVFDATKSLNQDVVELALINPASPEDFLMYYEHPANGEGK